MSGEQFVMVVGNIMCGCFILFGVLGIVYHFVKKYKRRK